MYNQLENPFNRQVSNKNVCYIDAVSHLLEALGDKDEQVKAAAEASLIKIGDKKPDEVILFVCEYKKKNSKLSDSVIAVVLR